MLGVALSLSAALGFGITPVLARLGLKHLRITTGTLVSLLSSTAITITLALTLHSHEVFDLTMPALRWFLLAGILNFPLGRLLNFTGIRLASVSRASPIIGASPLFATALAIILTGETINLTMFLGTAFIVCGLALILRQQ